MIPVKAITIYVQLLQKMTPLCICKGAQQGFFVYF